MTQITTTNEDIIGMATMLEGLFPGVNLAPMNAAIAKWNITGNFTLQSKDGTLSVEITINK